MLFVAVGSIIAMFAVLAILGLLREWIDRILGDDDGGWLARD